MTRTRHLWTSWHAGLSLLLLLGALAWLLPGAAQAQAPVSNKLAKDLQPLLQTAPPDVHTLPWAKTLDGQPHVKVLISAASLDPALTALRQDILARGGSVLYNYLSVRALAAMLPVSALRPLAARADVLSISPNRPTARQASLLQDSAGASTLPAPLGTALAAGLDGSGVGIAVLDSGIDWSHASFKGADGRSRVRAVVDFVELGRARVDAGWKKGLDYTASSRASLDGTKYQAGDAKYEPKSSLPDPYGHGSHVASIAAGQGG